MPELRIPNFRLGQRADGALRDDALWSLRRMKNWDVIYSDGRLRVRPGSERWNDSPLAAPADQLFYWIDREQNENLLALLGSGTDRWYVAKASGAHILLRDEAATARCMVVDLGDRLVFGTDTGLYWTDNASIPTVTPSYRLGIKKPEQTPGVAAVNGDGNIVGVAYPPNPLAGPWWELNNTTRMKIAAKLVVPRTETVWGLDINWYAVTGANGGKSGELRVGVYQDAAGVPGALYHTKSISQWYPLDLAMAGYAENFVPFLDGVEFTSGDTVWIVVEGDDNYYASYVGVAPWFTVGFGFSAAGVGEALRWSGAAWVASTNLLAYTLGGLTSDDYYDYMITYFNSQYGIESRPSERSERIKRNTFVRNQIYVTWVAPADPQIDRVRVYRRHVGSNPDVAESTITNSFELLGSNTAALGYLYDKTETTYLGDELQTQDHYCYDDTESGDDSRRTAALVPGVGCYWNGRIWLAEPRGAVFNFTKKLTRRGGTGIIGDSEPDFFPLNNKLELPVSSDVIAAQPIGDQQLGVYFRDESVWVIWGAADPLNPPADIMQRKILSDNGLIGPAAISEMLGRHVYLSRDGLHSYGGSQTPLYGVSSETNQTILDGIQDQYLRASVIAVFGPEIWMLVDRDNDGELDTVMILDLQRELPSREIMDRAWRMYEYSEALKDLVVKPTATTFRVMLAASADTNYILELGIATRTDLGSAIAWEVETHDMRGDEMAFAYELKIQAKYPGTPPIWTATVTDHGDRTVTYTFEPTSSMDIRGHRTGLRMNSPVSVRVKLTGSSVEADELRSLTVGYKGE